MSGFSTTRRRILRTGAGAAALGALGMPYIVRRVDAQGAFDWKRFKGEKIEVLLVKSPRGDLLQKYEKEFDELTGIKVGSEQIPEQQQRQKAVIEFTSGDRASTRCIALHVQKRLFAKGNWLADLRRFLKDPTLTAPDFDFADFAQGGLLYATQADGRDRYPAVHHRLLDALLQQGAVRRRRASHTRDLRRDGRRRPRR